jgi:ABC-type transport system involved in multi-copper enzyme maturation permease subunit
VGLESQVDLLLQIGGFVCIILAALPVVGLVGGALFRAGCYLVGFRMPGYLKSGLIFLLVSLASGVAGFLLVLSSSKLGPEMGLSPAASAIVAQVISVPIHALISMAAFVRFLGTTWRQGFFVWLAQLGIVIAVAAVIGLLAGIVHLPMRYQVAVFAVMILVLAVLLRQGWITLFGPVLFYDLVRIARRGRYTLLRIAYAILLLLVLWSTYASFTDRFSGSIPAQEMSKVASTFFFFFLIAQLAVVALLTPAFTGSAIAEEKDRKTLEFLLATDLRNREIVLSKLASRYCNLGLLVLTGLPILALTQFMGGVDPDLVLAGFAVTGVTMASLAALSILQSVYAKKPRDAIVLTYLGALAYLVISGMTNFLRAPVPGFSAIWSFGIPLPFDLGTPTVGDAVEALNAGNIFYLYAKLSLALSTRSSFADELLGLLRNYAVFHLAVALGCAALGVWKLRAVALQQTYGKPQKVALRVRWLGRPACGKYPMVWKEIFAEPGIRLAWFGRIVLSLLVGISMIPAFWIIIFYVDDLFERGGGWRGRPWRASTGNSFFDWLQDMGESMNIWVRIAGTAVAIILLLAVAVRAATTVSGERDRQTMDSLLTTTLDSTTILIGKLLGSIMSVRWGWLWLAMIWGMGLVTTGLNVLALPLVVVAWMIFAVFVANLGLWFSVSCRTSLRASIWTIMTTLLCFGGHWISWLCCIPFFLTGGGPGKVFEDVAQFQLFGLTPPFSLGMLAFQGVEFHETPREEPFKFLAFALFGLVFWAAAGLGLWAATCARFRSLSGRAPIPRRMGPSPRTIEMARRRLERKPLADHIDLNVIPSNNQVTSINDVIPVEFPTPNPNPAPKDP